MDAYVIKGFNKVRTNEIRNKRKGVVEIMRKSRSIIVLFLLLAIILLSAYSFYSKTSFSGNSLNTNELNTRQIIPWGVESANAPALWSDVTGKGVKVAVLDSGFDYSHPDFGDNIKEGYNAIEPGNPINDDYGHGTSMCGVIAAANNGFGIVGVAPDAELYPIKVLDEYGEGEISDIVEGIDWCIENDIQIINMSFAIEKDIPLLKSAVEKAINAGIIIIASAGSTFNNKVGYPASYEGVISLTAVDRKLKLGDYSPKGKIDFSAPGIDVVSTVGDGCYEICSGTSIAASYFTGLTALVLQNPQRFGLPAGSSCTRADVYNILKSFSKDLGEKGKDSIYGEGFVCFNKNNK